MGELYASGWALAGDAGLVFAALTAIGISDAQISSYEGDCLDTMRACAGGMGRCWLPG